MPKHLKKRHWLLSTLIIASLLIGLPSMALSLIGAFKAMSNMPIEQKLFLLIPISIGVLHEVGIIAIWFLRRWGVYLYFICCIPLIGIIFIPGMPAIYKVVFSGWPTLMAFAIFLSWSSFE